MNVHDTPRKIVDSCTFVDFHPYRTARVVGGERIRVTGDDARELVEHLRLKAAEALDLRNIAVIDNHTVFELRHEDGAIIYFWWTDLVLYIGDTVIQGDSRGKIHERQPQG